MKIARFFCLLNTFLYVQLEKMRRQLVFATIILVVSVIAALGSKTAFAVPILDGSYPPCTYSPNLKYCNGSHQVGDTCDNGPSANNSGGCPNLGSPACGAGNPWTKYQYVCDLTKGSQTNPYRTCQWAITIPSSWGLSAVCSTADKYQPNVVYKSGSSSVLDAGSCSCAIGGQYKICCARNPSTGAYSTPAPANFSCPEGPGKCPNPYPYDGQCASTYQTNAVKCYTTSNAAAGTICTYTSSLACPAPAQYNLSVNSTPISNVAISTPWGTLYTSFNKSFTSSNSFPLTAQSSVNSGGQDYSFYNWEYADGAYRQYSTSTTITITPDPSYLNISATANYQGAQKYYYCKTPLGGPNVCTQTSKLYPSVTACQNALTAVSSTGICYPTQSACQQDPQCATVSPTTYYYCSSNSCVSGKYSSISACNAANGTCYTSASCNSACGSATPPPANTGNDVSITGFAVNGVSAGSPTLACIPVNGVGLNDTLSWSATASNSCSNYTPQPVTECKPGGGTQTVSWSLSSPLSNPGTCSVQSSGGWSSSALFTNQGSGSFSPPVPANSTDYTLTCTRDPYTCTWTRPVWQEVQTTVCDSSGKNCVTTSTCESAGNVIAKQPINSSSQSESNTLAVIQPPTINNFTANPSNILIHKSTYFTWEVPPTNSNSPSRTVPTNYLAYPGGATNNYQGWPMNADSSMQINSGQNSVTPLSNTTYTLTVRNQYSQNPSCYAETSQQAIVNVYQSNLQESNPAALIENAFGGFLKKLGI